MGKGDNRDEVEAHYHRHFERLEKRESRAERKEAAWRDRSKYKKSDQRQLEKREAVPSDRPAEAVRGRVLSISSAGIVVEAGDKEHLCTLRGALKKERTRNKNLVTVGDFVYLLPLADDEGSIIEVAPRRSVLARADNLSRRQQQLIAANIDQVLITVSVVDPPLKPGLVDRYIIAAEKGGMQPIVVVNKVDLLGDDPQQDTLFESFLSAYQDAGVQVLTASCVTQSGLDQLKAVMENKASVFSGQSGVGKSSLINALAGLDLETAETVARTRKGAHTTTKAQLIRLDCGGWCIDTPGIKSFGVWDLQSDELVGYFPELLEAREQCRYPDCRHRGEEGCAVPTLVERGEVAPVRYESYLALAESVEQEHRRR